MKNFSFILFFFITAFFVCSSAHAQVSENRALSSFSKVAISGAMEIILQPGSEESISIKADNVPLSKIKTEVKGQTLHIGLEKGNYRNLKLKMTLTYKQIDDLNVSGAVQLRNAQALKATNLNFNFAGSCVLDLTIKAQNLKVKSAGASTIKLSGTAVEQNYTISGACNVEAFGLKSQNTSITMSGASNADIYASNMLSATISGVGNIKYKGKPKQTEFKKSGMGNVSSVD